jgi:hypothetical protein
MSTMTEARPARPARTDIRRPASGIVIDPAGLTWWRDRRAMSRQDLSDMITVLWLDGHPDALGRPELYTNSAGRRYYSKELREMYEQYLAQTRAGTGSTARVA